MNSNGVSNIFLFFYPLNIKKVQKLINYVTKLVVTFSYYKASNNKFNQKSINIYPFIPIKNVSLFQGYTLEDK